MMPNSSMWSNSCRATLSRSGPKRRVRAETGGPEVSLWCVTSCLMGTSVVQGCVMDENLARMASEVDAGFRGRRDGLGDFALHVTP